MIRGAAIVAALASGAAWAATYGVTIVNQTGAAVTGLAARPSGGGSWAPLAGGLSHGARTAANVTGDGCAYDVRGSLAGGGEVVWRGVNFCETRTVTLNRRSDGTAWVDYD